MPHTLLRRAAGLDTLRACHTPTFGWLSTVGWAGVDLFFVLSGYLIADQLLRGVQGGQPLSLWRFYTRRALRTWRASPGAGASRHGPVKDCHRP